MKQEEKLVSACLIALFLITICNFGFSSDLQLVATVLTVGFITLYFHPWTLLKFRPKRPPLLAVQICLISYGLFSICALLCLLLNKKGYSEVDQTHLIVVLLISAVAAVPVHLVTIGGWPLFSNIITWTLKPLAHFDKKYGPAVLSRISRQLSFSAARAISRVGQSIWRKLSSLLNSKPPND